MRTLGWHRHGFRTCLVPKLFPSKENYTAIPNLSPKYFFHALLLASTCTRKYKNALKPKVTTVNEHPTEGFFTQIHHACQRFCNSHKVLRLPHIAQRVEILAPAMQNWVWASKNAPKPSFSPPSQAPRDTGQELKTPHTSSDPMKNGNYTRGHFIRPCPPPKIQPAKASPKQRPMPAW